MCSPICTVFLETVRTLTGVDVTPVSILEMRALLFPEEISEDVAAMDAEGLPAPAGGPADMAAAVSLAAEMAKATAVATRKRAADKMDAGGLEPPTGEVEVSRKPGVMVEDSDVEGPPGAVSGAARTMPERGQMRTRRSMLAEEDGNSDSGHLKAHTMGRFPQSQSAPGLTGEWTRGRWGKLDPVETLGGDSGRLPASAKDLSYLWQQSDLHLKNSASYRPNPIMSYTGDRSSLRFKPLVPEGLERLRGRQERGKFNATQISPMMQEYLGIQRSTVALRVENVQRTQPVDWCVAGGAGTWKKHPLRREAYDVLAREHVARRKEYERQRQAELKATQREVRELEAQKKAILAKGRRAIGLKTIDITASRG